MPFYTWLMVRSSDEMPVNPEIRLDGWKLSFPSRPQIQPKELQLRQIDQLRWQSTSQLILPQADGSDAVVGTDDAMPDIADLRLLLAQPVGFV